MSELDDRQNVILQAWAHNELVLGHNGGEFGIEHAMMNAVTGESSKYISDALFHQRSHIGAGCALDHAVRLVARELAAAHMGYPYLSDCEAAMKEKEGE